MPLLTNIGSLATCRLDGPQHEIHLLQRASLVWEGSSLVWVGPEADLPEAFRSWERFDAGGRLVVPGLIDSHTHLAFGGWRADEFEQRLQGRSYLEIARAGGGILRTVRETRSSQASELREKAAHFLAEMFQLGITTVECKSGYGLDLDTELKLLQVYQHLSETQPVRIVATFLGAHVLPPEFAADRRAYVEKLTGEMIPEIARQRLARFCDVFVEESAFTREEAREILKAGKEHGLAPKLHADQLSSGGGAELAAELGAVSADHLERISEEGIQRMAEAGVTAVGLPLASLYLGQSPMPARQLIQAGVPVAVATDFNPGTAPSFHLPLAMTLACLLYKMRPAEVLKGVTVYAAKALGLEREIGSLEPGKSADFAVIDAPDVNHWLYHFRPNACHAVAVRGTLSILPSRPGTKGESRAAVWVAKRPGARTTGRPGGGEPSS